MNSLFLFQSDNLTLQVVNSRVSLDYMINGVQYTTVNWDVEASDGEWKRVYASRFGTTSRLTVTSISTSYSRTYGTFSSGSTVGAFMSNLMMIGGNSSITSPEHRFIGCVDNVRVNGDKVGLLGHTNSAHQPKVCNSSDSGGSGDRKAGSIFFGSGYLAQHMGDMSMNSLSVQLTFSTLKANGLLMAIVDSVKVC